MSIQHRTSITSFCLGPFGSEQNPPRIIHGIGLLFVVLLVVQLLLLLIPLLDNLHCRQVRFA
ncbi:hypothetical protein [Cohnella sp. WQ 127256]|uniref:hypothetical protein n=1 Tax=Cohnella sp. WQ 127256 TaxID=2938790 RepID=UPI002119B3AD|nr:hypothetical protein [Cohnella sp. WQ 127256]